MSIESLKSSPVKFPLVPKAPGNKVITFQIIDAAGFERGSIEVRCPVIKKIPVGALLYRTLSVIAILAGLAASIVTIVDKLFGRAP